MHVLLLAVLLAAVPPPIPDTPVGRAMSGWLAAFNGADRPQLEAVFEHFIETQSVEEAVDLRQQTGGLQLRKVLDATTTRMTVWLQETGGDLVREAFMEVEGQPPHRVRTWRLRSIPTPAELAPRRLPEREALQETRAFIDEMARKSEFSGCALIARRGRILFKAVRGFQDREKKIPNRIDTKFNLGSMNKMFTAVAALQLVQEGRLNLDDHVGKHIPDYPNAEVAKKVSVRDLLGHTGGMGDIFGPDFDARREKIKETRDYISLYGRRPPEFEPGSRWAYSNYGMVVAGAIIEKVSGQTYDDCVRDNVFQRAGMRNSGSYWKTESIPNLAKGYYTKSDGTIEMNFSWLPMRGSPSGGGYSTVEDLLRFATALTKHQLLDREHTALLVTPNPKAPADSRQYGHGFGFVIAVDEGVRSFGSSGGGPGINSGFRVFPDSGYVIAVLTNLDRSAASRVARFAAARLPAK